jgi:3-hydroxyacyl-[acyl-carrier-protein] dehydratase
MKNAHDLDPLHLGSNVIEAIIPFRRPLLMVDTVTAYRREPRPRIRASRQVTANEPVFAGHFPGLHLWPGIYTQEGLGQTGAILVTIAGMQDHWEARRGDPAEVLEAFRNLERGFTMHPGYDPEAHANLLAELDANPHIGLSASVELKFLSPVYAGQRIDYEAVLVKRIDQLARLEVVATVAGREVVKGVMTGSIVRRPPLPGRATRIAET